MSIMKNYCCRRCFSDDPTIGWKIHQVSSHKGTCDYCQSPAEQLVEPEILRSYFELFWDIYEPSADDGLALSDWLRSDWGIFDKVHRIASRQLIADIFSDPSLATRTFAVKGDAGTDLLALWNGFRESIKHSNRFFVNKIDQLDDALPLLESSDVPECFFRARIQTEDTIYPSDKMGAPPKDICGNGRANPAGIPYLYLASHDNIAISEVRPSPGDKVTVAKFARPERTLSLIDLRRPKSLLSPFAGEHPLQELRRQLSLLDNLGRELSTPVIPRLAQLEYLPCQYLCEHIKNIGFDGVIYNSSLSSDGCNYAIFDPSGFEAVECRTVLISGITIESRPYDSLEMSTP